MTFDLLRVMSVDLDWEDEEGLPPELADELAEAGFDSGGFDDDDVCGATRPTRMSSRRAWRSVQGRGAFRGTFVELTAVSVGAGWTDSSAPAMAGSAIGTPSPGASLTAAVAPACLPHRLLRPRQLPL